MLFSNVLNRLSTVKLKAVKGNSFNRSASMRTIAPSSRPTLDSTSYLTLQISRAQHILLAALAVSVIAGVSIALGLLAFQAKAENGDTPPSLSDYLCAQTPDDTSARGLVSGESLAGQSADATPLSLDGLNPLAQASPDLSALPSPPQALANPTPASGEPDSSEGSSNALHPGCAQGSPAGVSEGADADQAADSGAYLVAPPDVNAPATSEFSGDGSINPPPLPAAYAHLTPPYTPLSSTQLQYSGIFWTRSPYNACSADICEVQTVVGDTGSINHTAVGNSYNIRPTFFIKLLELRGLTQMLMVGTCERESRACLQIGAAKFDVIGINEGGTNIAGTCEYSYTEAGYSDNAAAQCPVNSVQLLLSNESPVKPASTTFSGELPGNRFNASNYVGSLVDPAMNAFYTSLQTSKLNNNTNHPQLSTLIIPRTLNGGAAQTNPASNTVAGAAPGARNFFPLSAQEADSVLRFVLPGPEIDVPAPPVSVPSFGLTCTTVAGPNYDAVNPGTVVQRDTYIVNGMRFEVVGYNDGTNRCGAGVSRAELIETGESGIATLLLKNDDTYNSYIQTAFGTNTFSESVAEYGTSTLKHKLDALSRQTGIQNYPGVIPRTLKGGLPVTQATAVNASCANTSLPYPGTAQCFNTVVGPDVPDQGLWPLSVYEALRLNANVRAFPTNYWLRNPYSILTNTNSTPNRVNISLVNAAGSVTYTTPYATNSYDAINARPALLFRLSDLPNIKEETSAPINFIRVTADKGVRNRMNTISPMSAANKKVTFRVDFNVSQYYTSDGFIYMPLSSLSTQAHSEFADTTKPFFKCSTFEADFSRAGGEPGVAPTSVFNEYTFGCTDGLESQGFILARLKPQGLGGVAVFGRYQFEISFTFNEADYSNKLEHLLPIMQLSATAYVDPLYATPGFATLPSSRPLAGSAYTLLSYSNSDAAYGAARWEQYTVQPTATLQLNTPQNVDQWKGGPVKYGVLRSYYALSAKTTNLQTSVNTLSPQATCHSTYLPAGSTITAANGNKALNVADATHVTVTPNTSGNFTHGRLYDKYSYCLTDAEAIALNAVAASANTWQHINTNTGYAGFTFQPPDIGIGSRHEMRFCDESRYVNQNPVENCYVQYFTRVPSEWKFDTSLGLTASTRYFYHRWPGDASQAATTVTSRRLFPGTSQYQDNRYRNYGDTPVTGFKILATQEYSPSTFQYKKEAFSDGSQLTHHARVALGSRVDVLFFRGYDESTGDIAAYNKAKLKIHVANLTSDSMEAPIVLDLDPDVPLANGNTVASGCGLTLWTCGININLASITDTFDPGDIIQAFELIPYGTDGSTEGELSPMNALDLQYYVQNRFPSDNRDGVWPDGTPFHVADYTAANGCYFDGSTTAQVGRDREDTCQAQVVSSVYFNDALNGDNPRVIETCSRIACSANDRELTMYKMDGNSRSKVGGVLYSSALDWNTSGKQIVPGNNIQSNLSFGINAGFNPLYEYVNPVVGMKVPHGLQMQGFTGTRDNYAPADGSVWTTPGGATVAQPYWQNAVNQYPSSYPTTGNCSHFPLEIKLTTHDDYYDYYTFTILNDASCGSSLTYAPTGDPYNSKYITAKMHNSTTNTYWGYINAVKWTATPWTYPGKFPGEWNAGNSAYMLPFSQEDKDSFEDTCTRAGSICYTSANLTEAQTNKYGFSAAALNFSGASSNAHHFVVPSSPQLSATTTFSVSSVDSGNFHASNGTTVGAQRGDTVKVKFTFTNNGNTPYTDFKLYFATPFGGDVLGSSGNIHFNGVTDVNGDPLPNSILMYNQNSSETATPAFGQAAVPTGKVLDLQTHNFWTHPSWDSTPVGEYLYVKSDIFGILAPGASYDVVLNYTMPADQGGTVISQVAYSANQPMLGVSFNGNTSLFGISTDSVPIRYNGNKPSDYPSTAFPGQNVTDIHEFNEDGEHDVFPNEAISSNCTPKVAGCYKIDTRVPKLKGYQFLGYELLMLSPVQSWDASHTPTYTMLLPGDVVNFTFADVGKKIRLDALWQKAKANVYFNSGNLATSADSPIHPGISATPQAGTITVGSKSDAPSTFTDQQYTSANAFFGDSNLYPQVTHYYDVYDCTSNPLNTSDLEANICRPGFELTGFYTSLEQAQAGGAPGKVPYSNWTTFGNSGAVDFDPKANGSYCAGVVKPWCPEGSSHALTLYARWETRQVILHFDNNGGTGTVGDLDLDYNAAYTKADLPGPSEKGFSGLTYPAKANYVFHGWAKTSACLSVENTFTVDWWHENTFYACWVSEPKIIFNSNGATSGSYGSPGFAPPDQVCLRNTACTLPKPSLAQMHIDYYTFIRWNTAADGSGTSYNGEQSYMNIAPDGGSVTLYAQWRGNFIRFDLNKNYASGADLPALQCYLFESCTVTQPSYTLPPGRTYYDGGTWGTRNGGVVEDAEGTNDALFGYTLAGGTSVTFTPAILGSIAAEHTGEAGLEDLDVQAKTSNTNVQLYSLWKLLPYGKMQASAVPNAPDTIAAEYVKHPGANNLNALKGIDVRCSNSAALASPDSSDYQATSAELIAGGTWGTSTWTATGTGGTYFEIAGVAAGQTFTEAAAASFPSWFEQFNWQKDLVRTPGDWRCQYRVIDRDVPVGGAGANITEADYGLWSEPSNAISFYAFSSLPQTIDTATSKVEEFKVGSGANAKSTFTASTAQGYPSNNTLMLSGGVIYDLYGRCVANYSKIGTYLNPYYGGMTYWNALTAESTMTGKAMSSYAVTANSACTDGTAPEATFSHAVPALNTPTVKVSIDNIYDVIDGNDKTKLSWRASKMAPGDGDGDVVAGWTSYNTADSFNVSWASSTADIHEYDQKFNIYVRDSANNTRKYQYTPWVRYALYRLDMNYTTADIATTESSNWPRQEYFALSSGGLNSQPKNSAPEFKPHSLVDPTWVYFKSSLWQHHIDNQIGEEWQNAPTECTSPAGTVPVGQMNVTYNCIFEVQPDTTQRKLFGVQVSANYSGGAVFSLGSLPFASVNELNNWWLPNLYVDALTGHLLKRTPANTTSLRLSDGARLFTSPGSNSAGAGDTFTGADLDAKAKAAALATTGNGAYPDTFTYTLYLGWEPNMLNITYSGGSGSTGAAPTAHTCSYSDPTCLLKTPGAPHGSLAKAGHYFTGWKVKASGNASLVNNTYASEANVRALMVDNASYLDLEAVWKPKELTLTLHNNHPAGASQFTRTFTLRYGEGITITQFPSEYQQNALNGYHYGQRPPSVMSGLYIGLEDGGMSALNPTALPYKVKNALDTSTYSADQALALFGGKSLNQYIIDNVSTNYANFPPVLYEEMYPFTLHTTYTDYYEGTATDDVNCEYGTLCRLSNQTNFQRAGYTLWGWKDTVTSLTYPLNSIYGNYDNNGLTNSADVERNFEAVWIPNAPSGSLSVSKGNTVTQITPGTGAVNVRLDWVKPSGVADSDIKGYQLTCKKNLDDATLFTQDVAATQTYAYTPVIYDLAVNSSYRAQIDCAYRIKVGAGAGDYTAWSAFTSFDMQRTMVGVYADSADGTVSGSITVDGTAFSSSQTTFWPLFDTSYSAGVQCKPGYTAGVWGHSSAYIVRESANPGVNPMGFKTKLGLGVAVPYDTPALVSNCQDLTPPVSTTSTIYQPSSDNPAAILQQISQDSISSAANITWQVGLSAGGSDVCSARPATTTTCSWNLPNTSVDYTLYYKLTDAAGNANEFTKTIQMHKREYAGNADGAGHIRTLPAIQYEIFEGSNSVLNPSGATVRSFVTLAIDTPWNSTFKVYCSDSLTCAPGKIFAPAQAKHIEADEIYTAVWIRNAVEVVSAHLYGADGVSPAKVNDTTQVFKVKLKWSNFGDATSQMFKTGTPNGEYVMDILPTLGGVSAPISEIRCSVWTPLNQGTSDCSVILSGENTLNVAGTWSANSRYIQGTSNTEQIPFADVFESTTLTSSNDDVVINTLPTKVVVNTTGVNAKHTMNVVQFSAQVRLDDGTPGGAALPSGYYPKGTLSYTVNFAAPAGTSRSISGQCAMTGVAADNAGCIFYAPAGSSGLSNPYKLAPASGNYSADVTFTPDTSTGSTLAPGTASASYSISKYLPMLELSTPQSASGDALSSLTPDDDIYITATLKLRTEEGISRTMNPVSGANALGGELFGGGLCLEIDDPAANSNCKPIVNSSMAVGTGADDGFDIWKYKIRVGYLNGDSHTVHAKYYGDILFAASHLDDTGITMPTGPNIDVSLKPVTYDVYGTSHVTPLDLTTPVIIYVGDVAPIAQRIPLGTVEVQLRKNFGDFAVVASVTNCNATHAVVDDIITTDGYGQVTCTMPKLEEGEYAFYAKFTGTAGEDVIANQDALIKIHTFRVSYLSSIVNLIDGSTHGDLTMNNTSPGIANGNFSSDSDDETWLNSLSYSGVMPKVGAAAGTSVLKGTVSAWTCRPVGEVCTGTATAEEDRIGPNAPNVYPDHFRGRIRVVISDDDASSPPILFYTAVDSLTGHFNISLPKFNFAGSYSMGVMYVDDPDIGTGEFIFNDHELFHFNVAEIEDSDYAALLVPGHFGQSVECETSGYANPSPSGAWPDLTYNKDYIQANGESSCNTQKQVYSVRFHAENVPEGVSMQDMPLRLQFKYKYNSDPDNAANTLIADSEDTAANFGDRPLSELITPLKDHHLSKYTSRSGHYIPGNYDSHWSYEFTINTMLLEGEYWVCGSIGDGLSVNGQSTNCFTLVIHKNELGPEPGSVCDDTPGNTNYDATLCGEDPTGGIVSLTTTSALKNWVTSTLSGEPPTKVALKVNFTGTPTSLDATVVDGDLSWGVYRVSDGAPANSGLFTKAADKRNFSATLYTITTADDYFLRITLTGDTYIEDETFDIPFTVTKEDSEVNFVACNSTLKPGCQGSVISSENGNTTPKVRLITHPEFPTSTGQLVPFIVSSTAFKASTDTACDELAVETPVFNCFAPAPRIDAATLDFWVFESDGITLARGLDDSTLAGAEQLDLKLEDTVFQTVNSDTTENNLPLDTSPEAVLRHGQVLAEVLLPEFEIPGVYEMKLCWKGDEGLNEADCISRTFTVRPDKERPDLSVTSKNYSWVNDVANSPTEQNGACSFYDADVTTDRLELVDESEFCLPSLARTDQGFVSLSTTGGDRTAVNFDFTSLSNDQGNEQPAEQPAGRVRVNIKKDGHAGASTSELCMNGQILALNGGCYIDALLDANARASMTLPKFSRFGAYAVDWQFIANATSKFDSAYGSLSENDAISKYPVAKARVYGGDGIEVQANFPKVVTTESDLQATVSLLTHKNVDTLFGCTDAQPDPTPTPTQVHDPENHIGCVELTLTGTNLDPTNGSSGTATHSYKVNVHPTRDVPAGTGLTPTSTQRYSADVTIPRSDITGVANIGDWAISARLLESDGLYETSRLKYFSFEGDSPVCVSLNACDLIDPDDTTFETQMQSTVNYALPSVSGVDGTFLGKVVKTESGIVVPQTGITSVPTQQDVIDYLGLHGYNVECWVDVSSQVLDAENRIDQPLLWVTLDGASSYNCAGDAVDFTTFEVVNETYVFMPLFHSYPGFCAKEFETIAAGDQTDCENGGGTWYEEDQPNSGSQLLLHFWAPLDAQVNPNLALDENGDPKGLLAGYDQTGYVIGSGWMCKDVHIAEFARCGSNSDASHDESNLSTNIYPTMNTVFSLDRSIQASIQALDGLGSTSASSSVQETSAQVGQIAPLALQAAGALDIDCDDTHEAWAAGQSVVTADGYCNVAQDADTNETGRFQGQLVLASSIHAGNHILIAEGVGEPHTSGVAVYALLPRAPLNPCPSNPSIEASDPACQSGGGSGGGGEPGGGGGSGNEPYCQGASATNQAECEQAGGKWVAGRCEGADASSEAQCLSKGGRWVAFTGASGWQIALLVLLGLALAVLVRVAASKVTSSRRRRLLNRTS